jgi:RNA polymerase sigma-70 factor (ECF subfamily)
LNSLRFHFCRRSTITRSGSLAITRRLKTWYRKLSPKHSAPSTRSRPSTNFKAWIIRILRNTFLTSRTGIATSRTVFLEDHPHVLDTTDASPTPEDNLIRLDNQAALQRALEQLEPPLREALLLCDVEEVKYKDIALILDIPIGTVMSRISRARRALRQLLQPQLGESQ